MENSQDVWEWDTVLALSEAFPNHLDCSLIDNLLLNSSLPSSAHETASDESMCPPSQVDNSVHTPSLPLPSPPRPLEKESQPRNAKVRKRDPRLVCPNYLAGLVPCSCPEADEISVMEKETEKEEELRRKRAKVGASPLQCQVPSCGSDISTLKGYHKRHRVCLACAISPQVLFDNLIQRYCQQCGKFHLLSAFDEGKRSCRKKLERHNNRRRRRNPVEELQGKETSITECENDSILFRSDGDGNASQSAKFHSHKPLSQASNTDLTGENNSGLESFPNTVREALDNFQTTKLSGIHANEIASDAPSQIRKNDVNSSKSQADKQSLFMLLMDENVEAEGLPCNLSTPNQLCGSESATLESPLSSSYQKKPLHYSSTIRKYDADSSKSPIDEQSLLTLLIDESVEAEGLPCNSSMEKYLCGSESTKFESPLSSSSQRKSPHYSSTCPTGRISFKFYAWNPADFPRKLREQIFEWLAKMPADLEAYVRGGCTILTFFIAMPQPTWDKFNTNWKCYLRSLLNGSRRELWGAGNIVIRMNTDCLLIGNGKILEENRKVDLLNPLLKATFPLCLEAGQSSEIFILGQNFSKDKARFLVSFADGFLDCDIVLSSETLGSEDVDGDQIVKVMVITRNYEDFGPAYVEVHNDTGVSNFIPILVADKEVCAEVNSLVHNKETENCNGITEKTFSANGHGTSMERCMVNEFLLDLGHVLRYLARENVHHLETKGDMLLQRLEKLLAFSIEMGWFAIHDRLVRVAESTGIAMRLKIGSNSHPGGERNAYRLDVPNHFSTRDDAKPGHNLKNCNQEQGLLADRTPPESLVLIEESDNERMPLVANNSLSLEVGGERKTSGALLRQQDTLSWLRKSKNSLYSMCAQTSFQSRATRRIALMTVSLLTVCLGTCLVLQHPHEVADISMSLRRCLWGGGSHDTSP